MGEIKSALELALERTADVKSDKASLEAHENKQLGMRLAGRYLEEPEGTAKTELGKLDRQRKRDAHRGFLQVLLSQLALPQSAADLQRLPTLTSGLELVIRDRRSVGMVMEQVGQLLQQYLDNKTQLIESLRSQFGARLRQREQAMQQQTGSSIKLDPASDPEFSKALSQHLGQLQNQYGQVIAQAKQQLTELFESGG